MNAYAQLYEQLSGRRDALIRLYGPRSGLKLGNPAAYQQYQQEIRELNRRLRLVRLALDKDTRADRGSFPLSSASPF